MKTRARIITPEAHRVLPFRPGAELVYQIFPDRWRNACPELTPSSGAWTWHGKPIGHSTDLKTLTSHPTDQHTFFGGDLEGVRQSLPYLEKLGVTAVYLTPIFAAKSTHRYDTIDYFHIDPALGNRADFERLSADLAQRHMKLILDGVLNHTSADHPLHVEPKVRRRHYIMKTRDAAMTWLNRGTLPKLDTQNPRTIRMLLDALDAWPETDAWRLDAAHLLPQAFLKTIKTHVAPRPVIVEDWMFSRHYFTKGLADGVTNFLFRETFRNYFTEDCSPETLLDRIRAWTDHYPARNLGLSWNYLDNHDTDRFLSQVGRERLARAFVYLFTLPGTPMLYHGIEIGQTGLNPGESRSPMPWDERVWDRDLVEHVRRLAALRRDHPVLSTGRYQPLAADNHSRTTVHARLLPRARAIVAVNDGYHAFRGIGLRVAPGEWQVCLEEKGKKTVIIRGRKFS